MLSLVWLIAACGGDPSPTPGPTLSFDRTGASPVLQLDELPAELELTPSTLPEGGGPRTRFELPPVPAQQAPGRRHAWVYDLPFPITANMERFAPEGMSVHLEGRALDYDMSPYAKGHAGWRIKDGQLHVVLHREAGPRGVTVDHPALLERLDRLEPERSGLSPEDFVRWTWISEPLSRPGLLLPAPSSAAWRVTLPEGARLRAWPTLLSPPLPGVASDGAEVVLVVEDDGRTTEVARRSVASGDARPGILDRLVGRDTPGAWQVDLSRWGGREVGLRLETRVRGRPEHDYVFLGAPAVWGEPTAQVRRVIVIALDTTRPDHLGVYGYDRPTSPELDAHAGRSAVFDQAWTPAPRTRPSFRSSTTGRGALDAVGATNFGEVFREHGFATAGIVANIHLNPRFGFHEGFDLWHLEPRADADDQVDLALGWLREHRDRDSFLFLHFMDPHLVYSAPLTWKNTFVTDPDPTLPSSFNRWEVEAWQREGELDEQREEHIVALHDGEVAFTSHEVGRFLAGLEELGGNALVVVHSDHGEEFWEHGGFEHNHTLYDEVVKAAFWIQPPGAAPGSGQRLAEPVTLADIAPTLYDWVGFEDPPPTDGRSLKPLIEGRDPGGWDRPVPLGHLMYDREQWGVVWRGHKYLIETASGREELYDLGADPRERRDLSQGHDLDPWREALGRAHGMPVGPGWRVHFDVSPRTPLVWTLPAPAEAAGVIDPEAERVHRANLVWGEPPRHRPDEVAEVDLSEDGRTLVIRPGAHAEGIVWVRFNEPVEPGGSLVRGRRPMPLEASEGGQLEGRLGGARVRVRAGTVLDPPPGEAARIEALGGSGDADRDDLELLRALGYVGGDDDE